MELVNKIDEKELFAARSMADAAGNNIADTYAQKTEIPDVSDFVTQQELSTELNTKQDNLSTEQLYNIDNAITSLAGVIVAGPGVNIYIDEENKQIKVSSDYNETVIFFDKNSDAGNNTVYTLSEDIDNFNFLRVTLSVFDSASSSMSTNPDNYVYETVLIETDCMDHVNAEYNISFATANIADLRCIYILKNSSNSLKINSIYKTANSTSKPSAAGSGKIVKVVGIGRKAGV